MDIEWTSLGEVFVISLGVTVAIVVVFSVGMLAYSARQTMLERGGSGGAGLAARRCASPPARRWRCTATT